MRRRILRGKSLFENEPGAQEQRLRAAHRQIVHGAVHRQRSDIAAREKQRLDHEGVGGESHPRSADLENRLIVQAVQDGIRKQRQEHVAQQLGAQPSPAAVAEHDPLDWLQRRRASKRRGINGRL